MFLDNLQTEKGEKMTLVRFELGPVVSNQSNFMPEIDMLTKNGVLSVVIFTLKSCVVKSYWSSRRGYEGEQNKFHCKCV